MIDILAMQQAMPIAAFPPGSRYAGLPLARTVVDGREVAYVTRRFVPQPESLSVIGEHVVTDRERLDHVAARYLGDPELFWRICDANRALRPIDLMVRGRRLAITLPEGVPGIPNA